MRTGGALTLRLLGFVAGDSAYNRVLVASGTVDGALSVTLGLSSLVFCLSGSVLLLSRCLPRGGTGDVTDGLDDVALQRVVLTGALAVTRKTRSVLLISVV